MTYQWLRYEDSRAVTSSGLTTSIWTISQKQYALHTNTEKSPRRNLIWYLLCMFQYNVSFYLQYLARWPEYCLLGESIGLQKVAYSEWRRLHMLYIPQYLSWIVWHNVIWFDHFITFAVLGKVEGEGRSWHGHVTAVTVCPTYRRQRIAQKLMDILEDVTADRWDYNALICPHIVHTM